MSSVFVEIVATRGSVPRGPGTVMEVTPGTIRGTIGGGALEYEAILHARALLQNDVTDDRRRFALGPSLGQCCGGAVTLHFTTEPKPVDAPLALTPLPAVDLGNLWLWGAGHVGRAVVRALPAGGCDVTWIDTAADRFPEDVPDHITCVCAADMAQLARRAPGDARHLIFTYSHEIDFALCAALLRDRQAKVGLIGSETKKTRFFKRLRQLGLDPTPIRCPIGHKALGKHPDQIAHGVILELMGETCTA